MRGNESLGAACLTTAFLLSQREAAVRWILKGPETLKQRFLPDAARGIGYLTIGISQLTTSRQHCAPALLAEPFEGGFRLDGVIPWVTGASGAQAVVAGAVLENSQTGGEQILFVLSLKNPGVKIGPPMALSALAGSCTSEIRCEGVWISREDLLAGPGSLWGPAAMGARSPTPTPGRSQRPRESRSTRVACMSSTPAQ
jgi:alkylation response protein AidB-like acyl-CoA dehydrogenase